MTRSELLRPATGARNADGRVLLRAEMSGVAPVFLHTGWRTRGTWIWSRFRALAGTTCFYEPLCEELATLSPAVVESRGPESWPSGHPPLRRPYFAEFRPLLKTAGPGVLHHDPNFAVAGFFAEPDAAMPDLRDYIELLLRTAHAEGGQPVLKFCRSVGRIGWMQRNFPQAIHIALMRNPLAQFISAQRQLQRYDNPYFLAMPLMLLAVHRDVPEVAAAVRHLAVALPSLPAGAPLHAALAVCAAHLRRSEPPERYRGFLAFWVATAMSTPDTIDAIIDSDLLTCAADYRRQCEIDLATLTGRTIDLSDALGGSGRDASILATSGLCRAGLWRAHGAAEAFLAEHAGEAWADSPLLARIGAMLSYATLLGTGPLHASDLAPMERWDAVCAEAAALAVDAQRAVSAERRAASAEQRLAEMYASHSWRVTAPLRWLSERLPAFGRGV
jgi:hypothetical protein